jgi:5-hydroxyisourate hydrolase-like protein (transthyretin family)
VQSTRTLRRTVLAATLAGIAAATTAAGPAFADDPTGSISGVVRDTRGAVIPDAVVSVYRDPSSGPVKELQPDAHGRFRVAGLKAGSYKIQISMQGWSEWAPGRISDADRAGTYQVTANRTTVADSVVTRAGFITGRFFGPDGEPAAHARVEATNVDNAAEHSGRTAADGTYRLRVQPNQTFTIGYAVGPSVQYVPHTFDRAQATKHFVRSGQTLRVTDRAVALSGMSGRLTDAAGAPAGGVSVEFYNVDTTAQSETVTRADGSYDVSGQLAPGRYKVRFTAAGRSQYAHQALDYDSADVITLTSGRTAVVDDQLLWVPTPQ